MAGGSSFGGNIVAINSAQDVLVLLSILSMLLGGLIWLIRTQVQIRAQTAHIRHETSPNSGGSMKDKIDFVYDAVKSIGENEKEWRKEQSEHNKRIYDSLGKVHARIDGHLTDHLHDQVEFGRREGSDVG